MEKNEKILIIIIAILLIFIAVIGTYTFLTLNNDNNVEKNNQSNLTNISNTSINNPPKIHTEKFYIGSNTEFGSSSKTLSAVTSSDNFVITMTQEYTHANFDIDDPFTGYLTIKTISPNIKIISIEVKQGNGFKGFNWKTHNINSKTGKTINLGKNTLANVYQEGNWGQLTYIIQYEKT